MGIDRGRPASLVAGMVVALTMLAGVAHGGTETPSPGTAPAPDGPLDLSIRARALGTVSDSVGASALDLRPGRAPTGAGSLRMAPLTTEIGHGVYLSVGPSCFPGDDLRATGRRLRR